MLNSTGSVKVEDEKFDKMDYCFFFFSFVLPTKHTFHFIIRTILSGSDVFIASFIVNLFAV